MPTTHNGPACAHTSVGIHCDVAITAYLPTSTQIEMAGICIGSNEALRIDSADLAGLENLRDATEQAISQLRVRIQANAQARATASTEQPDDGDLAQFVGATP